MAYMYRGREINSENMGDLSYAEAVAVTHSIREDLGESAASEFFSLWQKGKDLSRQDRIDKINEEASDPMRQILTVGGGAAAGGILKDVGSAIFGLGEGGGSAAGTGAGAGTATGGAEGGVIGRFTDAVESLFGSGGEEAAVEAAAASPDVYQTLFDVTSAGERVPAGQATQVEQLLGMDIPGAETLAAIGQYVGPAIGAYNAYNLLSDDRMRRQNEWEGGATQGALSGAGMGSYFGLPGAAIGAILGGLVGLGNSQFGSGKDTAQRQRDELRSGLNAFNREAGREGFYDNGNLSFGDVNADTRGLGYTPMQNESGGINFEPGGPSYNINLNEAQDLDSEYAKAVGGFDALLGTLLSGAPDQSRVSDLVGEFTNAAMTSSNPTQAVRAAYDKAGADRETLYTATLNDASLTPEERNIRLASIDRIYEVVNPNQGLGGTAEFGAAYIPGT